MSGLGFLRERRALKEFEALDASFRRLVLYSEGPGDWPHIGPVLETLLAEHDVDVAYLSSDVADPGLALDHPRLRSFMIGDGTVRTILFARIDCAHFVMTLPDLDQLWLKRSQHPVHYVYLFHSLNSTHAAYRKAAFDAYDTVLCVGPHHVAELRATEARYDLPAKELVEHGSVKLDSVLAEVARRRSSEPGGAGGRQVLIAPSWGDCSLIERPVGIELVGVLLAAGYETVLRLHPMTVRRLPKLVEELRRRFAGQPGFLLEEDMSAVDSWLGSDVMVSDWSGAALEYAFALGRPVVYVDTPQKTVNEDWQELGIRPFEDAVRDELGLVVPEHEIATLPAAIEAALADPGARERALDARERSVFNVGSSARVAAGYLASLAATDAKLTARR